MTVAVRFAARMGSLTGLPFAGAPVAALPRHTMAHLIGHPVLWPPSARSIPKHVGMVDREDGGHWRLRGHVRLKVGGAPLERAVWLMDLLSGRVIRKTRSNSAGLYVFEWIANKDYLIYSVDHTGRYNGTIAVKPPLELMP